MCEAQALIFRPLVSTQGKPGLQAVSAIKQESKGQCLEKIQNVTKLESTHFQDSVQLLIKALQSNKHKS